MSMARAKLFVSLPAKPPPAGAWLVLLLVAVAAKSQVVCSSPSQQTCSPNLGQLAACARLLVPGQVTGPPDEQCCASLGRVDHGCLCDTLSIIARLPTRCNLPRITCGMLSALEISGLQASRAFIIFRSRVLGRVLCAAAKSESSAAAASSAASTSVRKAQNPLEEFFEVDRSTDEEKPVIYGTIPIPSFIFRITLCYCLILF
ncbi:hypothetical protein GW17_00004938 [Ensete ventricosum]|nr:hypothetical protein GW17_00004938 [Ensete ventricosum]